MAGTVIFASKKRILDLVDGLAKELKGYAKSKLQLYYTSSKNAHPHSIRSNEDVPRPNLTSDKGAKGKTLVGKKSSMSLKVKWLHDSRIFVVRKKRNKKIILC